MPSDPPVDPPTDSSADSSGGQSDPPAGPKWKQIRDELARAIIRRTFRPRTKLPTVRQLKAEFGCGTLTVQTAMAQLQGAGFVAPSRAGSPYRVAKEPPAELPAAWGASEPPGVNPE